MNRALVTGATGCLGRHLAIRLAEQGWEVTGMGRQQKHGTELEAAGIRFYNGDIRDQAAVNEVCSGQDVVFHCAALSSPWGKYRDFYSSNVEGTQHLVDRCLKGGVKRFIHVSTPSIYFNYSPRYNIHENDPLPSRPANHYAATKWLAEQVVLQAHANGLPSIMIRPRAIFGPYDQTLFPRIVAANAKAGVPMIGGGQALIDLTCVDNVVDALLLCWDAKTEALGRAYNVSNGDPRPFQGLVSTLFGMLEMPLRRRSIPYRAAYGAAAVLERVHRLIPALGEPQLTRYTVGSLSIPQTLDITDAREKLGYAPRLSIDEGLQQFANWWRAESC
ncbi:NAD-dependent epimerase/dehydratase family protein [Paenibacillus pabuli]|uniref:NAD-dependent epimerase/dehydratase family protein n=1 Tax=Paenibacillus pabuli TaxID=1472 RepID=UPI001FFE926C|nr:SDR family NAD(P)-dependent oxidoreductase [Paenibacillus pabuli]UPK45608.1 SDR family NAD(P)-dependent oxidoreductase [Paenibacillus pabuli]